MLESQSNLDQVVAVVVDGICTLICPVLQMGNDMDYHVAANHGVPDDYIIC